MNRRRGLSLYIASSLLLINIFTAVFIILSEQSASATLLNRSLNIQNAQPSAETVYDFSFTYNSNDPVGSIVFEFCTDYLFENSTCDPPSGFFVGNADIVTQTGETGFTVNQSATTGNRLVVSRPASPVSDYTSTYQFSPITNPDQIGSYYVKVSSYASSDGTGSSIDSASMVFSINRDITVTTEVPPFLEFCVGISIAGFNCGTVTGDLVNLGELSANNTASATSQMMAATNAGSGYSISVTGTTMTSGNQVIPSMNNQSSSPGTSQFGLNVRQNNNPSIGSEPQGPGLASPSGSYGVVNNFTFNSNDTIVSSPDSDNYKKFTTSYIVNVSNDQAPGVYTTTINYVCLANF